MCGGASSQQDQVWQMQSGFLQEMMNNYSIMFGQNQRVLNNLTPRLMAIFKAGPGQKGFTAPEEAALRTSATDKIAQNFSDAEKAVQTRQFAQGGRELPSGVNEQVMGSLATEQAINQAEAQNEITKENYDIGRSQYWSAAQALGSVAGLQNPVAYAGAANQASSNAGSTAESITQADNSWMNLVGGALGAAGTAASGYFGHH